MASSDNTAKSISAHNYFSHSAAISPLLLPPPEIPTSSIPVDGGGKPTTKKSRAQVGSRLIYKDGYIQMCSPQPKALPKSFCDATIAVAGGREIKVHRCILSSRSPFFKHIFSATEGGVKLEMKDLAKDFEVGYDALFTVLEFLYCGKARSLHPDGVCVCVDDECEHVACRPAVDFAAEVLYASFVFEVPELVALYQRHLLDILDEIAADDILVVLFVANICGKECDGLLNRCVKNIVRSDVDMVTLDKTLPSHIFNRIVDSRKELGFHGPESSNFSDRHVIRLHRALDSHDVELVRMLIKEGHTSIDDACALHYAVAYCDAKIIMQILDLAIADVNHRSPRGYTVLHIAAMRKEPKIIVSLLTKGAQPAALTSDGRKALTISKRLTRAADYYKSTEQRKASPKDRLCIEILEQAERIDSFLGEASLAKAEDDLQMKALYEYLEGRVDLAKRLFPMEANVAMDVAQVDGASGHLNRIKALAKTVELGKRFFPHCSEVIDVLVDDDDLSRLVYIQNGTPEERQLKKRRFMEIQEAFIKAFHEDKEELGKSFNISSSSRPLGGVGRPNVKEELDKFINISSSSRPLRRVGRSNAVYDPGSHTKDSLALISPEVHEALLIPGKPNDCVPLLPLGGLTHKDCVQQEKSPDRLIYKDGYIQMCSPQPKALPDGGQIVLLDSSEHKPSVDFYATSNRAYQSDVLVSNSTREASKRQCIRLCVLSLADSTAGIYSSDFNASYISADLMSAYQSGPVVFNSEKKDTGEGLNTECLTKSVHILHNSSKQKSLPDVAVTESKSHLVRACQNGPVVSISDNKSRGEALKRECIPNYLFRSEDLQQHSGGKRDDAAKSFCAVYDPGSHTKDSLALISPEVHEALLIREQPNDCVPLLPLGGLTHKDCVQREKSPDLFGVAQINGVEQRVNKLPRYLGGLTVQSASSSRWPIGLPDGGHIVLHDPLDQSAIHIEHAARADQCSPTLFLGEKKMVRKTLHRKRRTTRVLFVGNRRHFARGCEDAAKSLGATHIFRKHGINQVSTMKRIKKHGIHQWPFRQKWATRKGDLQQHFGCKRKHAVKSLGVGRSMFKSTCRQDWVYWWPHRFEKEKQAFNATSNRAHLVKADERGLTMCNSDKGDSLAWKSFKVPDSLPLGGQSNSIRNLARQRTLTHKHCVRLKNSQDQPRSMQRDYSGGLAAQSAIGLPDRRHILPLSEKKIVTETLKRKCRSTSTLGLVDRQHVDRWWGDAAKSHGTKRICRQLCTAKHIPKQHGIHRWPFQRSAISLPDGGHILPLSEKKIVRKTLKRKCRRMRVLSLVDRQQHVHRRWEDAAKNIGAKRICRQLVIHRVSIVKRRQHEIHHRWPFQQSAVGPPNGGHVLPLSEKKILRKTLKRKCRSISVLSLVDRQQHVDRRSEDAVKNIGVKPNCGQLVIHRVSRAKRICRQHEIYHRWPFEQDWATMKGYSLGDERPVEVICISTHVKLGSRLQLIYISWLGRFSPRPSALVGGGEIGGPLVSSCSGSAATNYTAQRFGRDQSGSAASDSENERTREQGDPEDINDITVDDIRPHYGRRNRDDTAAILDISVSTFKRLCRKFGIKRWPNVRKRKVGRPPDRHGKGNTSTARKTPSHDVQTGMEVELAGQNQEANELRQDFLEGSTALNTVNDSILAVYSGTETFQVEGQTTQSTCFPYYCDVFSQSRIATTEVQNENMGSSEDGRDLFTSQVAAPEEEPLSEEHVFGYGNTGNLAPSQPMQTFPQTMESSENWPGILPFLGGDLMESLMVSPWSDPAPSQTMPAIQHTTDPAPSQTMPAIHHTRDTAPSQTMPAIHGTMDPAPSQTMAAIHHTMDPRMTPPLVEGQDEKTVKAEYRDIIIKFDLPLTSGIKELREVVSETLKTLECEFGRFRIQYQDEEGDWISMGRDENVREYLQIATSKGSKEAKLQVIDY